MKTKLKMQGELTKLHSLVQIAIENKYYASTHHLS